MKPVLQRNKVYLSLEVPRRLPFNLFHWDGLVGDTSLLQWEIWMIQMLKREMQ